jgi:predicted acylesterase/phospholipase RssA
MKRKLGLVLGGGGVRCLTHLGVAEVLLENNIKPDLITCSSTGTIIAILLATGIKPEAIRQRMFKLGQRSLWWLPTMRRGGLFSQMAFRHLLRAFDIPPRLEDLKIPVHVVLTDLVNGVEMVMREGDTIKIACASAALPGVYPPITINGMIFSDGGVTNNVPADVCRREVGDQGIVITSSLEMNNTMHPELLKSTPQVIYRSIYMPLVNKRYHNIMNNSDIVIQPFSDQPLCFSRWSEILRFHSRSLMLELLEKGRVHMERNMPTASALLAMNDGADAETESKDEAGLKRKGENL